MSLIVIGTVAIDNIKTSKSHKKALLGGSAAHFSMSARLFSDVHLVGIVGEDFPKRYIKLLKDKDIDLTSLINRKGKTFQWHGEYEEHDLNTAITHATELGVLMNYSPHVAAHQRDLPNVFLANIDPDVQIEMLKLMNRPKLIGLDSMNLWIDIKLKSLKNLVKMVDLFVLNDAEARSFTDENNLIKAAKVISKMGPKYVIIKKGEHGVLFYCDKFMFGFPAYPVEKVLDPTGAGDTFAGGFMGYLSKHGKTDEKSLRKALLYATTMSSFNVEGYGMEVTSKLTMKDVNDRLKKLEKFVAI